MTEIAIGIDLGTTYSVVGAFRNGRVEILENAEGDRITPSTVAFLDNDKILVGTPANRHLINKAGNVIYDMKRLIGIYDNNEVVNKNKKFWTFNVVEKDDRPTVEVSTKKENKEEKNYIKPEEVSAKVLKKMKETAERKFRVPISKAVITVPAYFNHAQKQATIKAANIAGLDVVNLVSEPAAAAFAYGFDNNDYKGKKNILVEDIGGGTYDVVVVHVNNGSFIVKSIGGDTQLGGRDFDNRLVEHFAQKIKTQFDIDVFQEKEKKNRQKILQEALDIKHTLSSDDNARYKTFFIKNFTKKIIRVMLDGGQFFLKYQF